MTQRAPGKIKLRSQGAELILHYAENKEYALSAEYLRVESPSAEVRGHGGQGGQLPVGKENVRITSVERMGNYALQFTFDDGHDSGIYTWEYLYQLALEKDRRWHAYLQKLQAIGKSRDPGVQVVRLIDPKQMQ